MSDISTMILSGLMATIIVAIYDSLQTSIIMSYKKKSNLLLFTLLVLFTLLSIWIYYSWTDFVLDRIPGDHSNYKDLTNMGAKGDTFGGTIGPVIAWLAALITFAAFWVQYTANQTQKRDLQVERFENKFYELIKLHDLHLQELSLPITILVRNNDQEILPESDEVYSLNKVFLLLYDELKFIFLLTERFNRELTDEEGYNPPDARGLFRIAYIFFYAGVGTQSDFVSQYIAEGTDERLVNAIRDRLKSLRTNEMFESYQDRNGNTLSNRDLHRHRFTGHQNMLGRYYRHLYMIVKFVAEQKNNLIDEDQKESYLKTLRVQLSDFEQLMLYFNALADFGTAWIDNEYFTKYRMIHNIPLPLANFGITPEDFFEDAISNQDPDKPIFEWS